MTDSSRDDTLQDRDAGRLPEPDNDQDSHVSPSDNDGETVPQDEVDG